MPDYTDKTRLDNSKKNIKFATLFQLSAATLGFVERAFFINYMSSEYLGLKGLIMSILMVLTITEYGISSSLAFYLYKPLVNNNTEKIKAIIKFIRRVYNTLTITVIILGLALLPIFPTIANTLSISPNQSRIYFLIYLIGTALCLKFSYHAIVIQADQKQYITTFYISTAQIIQLIAQIFVLIFTQNFYIYAIIFAIANSFKFIFVRIKSKKLFTFLKGRSKGFPTLSEEILKKIKKETRVLIFHKMSFSITMTIECILISYLLGASTLGIFTNYQLVILGLATGIAMLQKSFESSIGNLCTIESKEYSFKWFLKINHVFGLCFGYLICLLVISFTPFFNTFFVKAETFDFTTTILITLTQYFFYKRLIITIFESCYGIFYQDRIKPFAQTISTIVLSYIFCKLWGIKGVFLGVIISELATSTWIEPYMVHKYGFKTSIKPYIKDSVKCFTLICLSTLLNRLILNQIHISSLLTFLIGILISASTYILCICLIFPQNGKVLLKWIFTSNKSSKELIELIP